MCLKQTFIGTVKLGEHKKILQETAPE